MLIKTFLFLLILTITYSYKANPTQYICTQSTEETSQTLLSCLPGYIIDIENVIYESTYDNTCFGTILCQIENKNTLLFACNRKRTCQINKNNLHFHINSTCGTTIRFFVQYHCLPVIQEQKDHLCESSTNRRPNLGDINLSCTRNYRLHITTALIGLSIKPQDELTAKTRFKCNKDTQTICMNYIPNAYRDICENQLNEGNIDQCKIPYHQRPMLKDCQNERTSNFSLVEYLCIPDVGIKDDLPRIDICSNDIPIDHGLLHSPSTYPQDGICKKQFSIPRESRLRLFMLEKSGELNIYLFNNIIQTLARNELLDVNRTNQHKNEIVQFEWKNRGEFLLYFQIDSRLSEYAPFVLEHENNQRGKLIFNQAWGIVIGCVLGLLLVITIIFILIRISKRRGERRRRRYLKSDDDHRQHLNVLPPSPDHHRTIKGFQIEQPYLISSSPTILPSSSSGNDHRPNSASSTTSSIIIHPIHDGISEHQSLIKPISQIQPRANTDIDNFYEEIKEQQQQTALALGSHQSAQPIRDHHENELHYQRPQSSDIATEQSKLSKNISQHLTDNND